MKVNFWPFSNAHVVLPIPYFESVKLDPLLCLHNLRIFAIEAAVYGSILGITLAIKHLLWARLARRHDAS